MLIPGEPRSWVKIILSHLPEVPDLDIQLCDSSVDILSNRTLSVDGKRCVSGPLNKLAPDDYVRLPWVAFQLNLDVPLLLGLLHKRVQILTTENLNDGWRRRKNPVSPDTLTLGGKLSPRQIAQAMLLFPVPLGPMTMFRWGPGQNSTKS